MNVHEDLFEAAEMPDVCIVGVQKDSLWKADLDEPFVTVTVPYMKWIKEFNKIALSASKEVHCRMMMGVKEHVVIMAYLLDNFKTILEYKRIEVKAAKCLQTWIDGIREEAKENP